MGYWWLRIELLFFLKFVWHQSLLFDFLKMIVTLTECWGWQIWIVEFLKLANLEQTRDESDDKQKVKNELQRQS